VLEKYGEDQLDRSREKRGSIRRVKENRNIIHTIKRRKANWIGHFLHRNRVLKHTVEGNVVRGIEMTGERRKKM
jgi:hypothetical protein